MSKEEPAWKAELEASIRKFDAYYTREWLRLLEPHILAAEQRGFQAGVNKTGDSVGKLREQLKAARADARREAAAEIREDFRREFTRVTANMGVDPARYRLLGGDHAADLIAPDKP